jgi:hypothetical protein
MMVCPTAIVKLKESIKESKIDFMAANLELLKASKI